MSSLVDWWPPYAVRIVENDLTLTVMTDDDLPGLIELALAGIHDPRRMPFSVPWTRTAPDELPAAYVRYASSSRASFTAKAFDLNFVVRLAGEVVGVQAFETKDFAITRTGETGSWLGRRFQGQGLGTRMRRAVCAFAFDHLGAVEISSGAFLDNPASLGVSRTVGYEENGRSLVEREGQAAMHQKLILRPERFVRGEPIEVTGVEPLRRFVGLD